MWIWLGVPLAVLFAAILLQRLEAALLTGPEIEKNPNEITPVTPMASPEPDPPVPRGPAPRGPTAPPAPWRASA